MGGLSGDAECGGGALEDVLFGGVHFEEVKATLGGEGVGGLRVALDEGAKGDLEFFGILVAVEFPTGDLSEPFGLLFFGGVRQVAEQCELFDSEIDLAELFGEDKGEFFAGGNVVWIFGEFVGKTICFGNGVLPRDGFARAR